jgi:hypothetical protein
MMIRSRGFPKDPIRERLAERRWGLRPALRETPRAFCMLIDGKLMRGTDTLHRTAEARRWRTVLRLRRARKGLQ